MPGSHELAARRKVYGEDKPLLKQRQVRVTTPLYRQSALTISLALMGLLICGCSALSSTTRQAGKATAAIAHGITYMSKATGNASVTEPDVPRYADAAAFVRSQRPLLARQAAGGGGEDIDALALLLGRSGDDLGRWMQTNYAGLFAQTPALSARGLVDRIDAQEG